MSEEQTPYITGRDPDAITPENLKWAGWARTDTPSFDEWKKVVYDYPHISRSMILYVAITSLPSVTLRVEENYCAVLIPLPHITTMTQLKALWALLSGQEKVE